MNVVAYALTAWIVWLGAKLLGHTKPILALYIVLWNPLLLTHHIANGHNDLLIGFLIALSLYLALQRRFLWIVPVLVAATLLKYGPALLLPLAAIYIVKKSGWSIMLLGCAIGALLLVVCAAPYWVDWQSLKLEDIRDNATLIDNSLHSLLIHIYGTTASVVPVLKQFHDIVNSAIKVTLRGGFMIFFGVVVWKLFRRVSMPLLTETFVGVMFVLICVASSKFNAWYMAMLLPPALLLREDHWLRRLIILITCTELLSITFFKHAYMLNYFALILVPLFIVLRQLRREKAAQVSDISNAAVGPASAQHDDVSVVSVWPYRDRDAYK